VQEKTAQLSPQAVPSSSSFFLLLLIRLRGSFFLSSHKKAARL
jgi:hypothetical protein